MDKHWGPSTELKGLTPTEASSRVLYTYIHTQRRIVSVLAFGR